MELLGIMVLGSLWKDPVKQQIGDVLVSTDYLVPNLSELDKFQQRIRKHESIRSSRSRCRNVLVEPCQLAEVRTR